MNADALRELREYRATGMTPEGIRQMLKDCELDPSPLPLIPNEAIIINPDWDEK